MEKFNVCLNLKKCVFGFVSGKLLGYIVSKKVIEVDPRKVQAIMDMPPPRNISQLKSLQGHLQSIRSFIAQLANKSLPFTHLLHKNVPFKWEEKCELAFNQIKQYLMNPPVFVPPTLGEPLILYISTTKVSLGVLLAQ
jgi:hypothetical protein